MHRLTHRPNTVRAALASGWLAFVSAGEKRRLPGYPTGWTELPDGELQTLLDAALLAPGPKFSVGLPGIGEPRSKATTVTSVAAPATISGGGLPVPISPTVTGTLGTAGIDGLVREQAQQARREGLAVIQGMVRVKRALRDAGEDVSSDQLRLLRKIFIDEFYFAR